MLRQQQLKEYLERKEKEEINEKIKVNKQKLQECLEKETNVPHELKEQTNLIQELLYNVHFQDTNESLKVSVTTSRKPSSMLKEFTKKISLIFNAKLISRGQMNETELIEMCNSDNTGLLILINENKGRPTNFIFNFVKLCKKFHFSIFNYQFNRKKRLEKYKENCGLIIENFGSNLALEIKSLFGFIFKKREKYSRILLLKNEEDLIYFRHYFLDKKIEDDEFKFELKLYKIDNEVDQEFISRSYINSAGKIL